MLIKIKLIVMIKVVYVIVICNCFLGMLILGFRLLDYYSEDSFIIALAILAPLTTVFVDIIVTYLTKKDSNSITNTAFEKDTIWVLALLLGFYCLSLLTVVIYHAFNPMPLSNFVKYIGVIQVFSGFFIQKIFKNLFKYEK